METGLDRALTETSRTELLPRLRSVSFVS